MVSLPQDSKGNQISIKQIFISPNLLFTQADLFFCNWLKCSTKTSCLLYFLYLLQSAGIYFISEGFLSLLVLLFSSSELWITYIAQFCFHNGLLINLFKHKCGGLLLFLFLTFTPCQFIIFLTRILQSSHCCTHFSSAWLLPMGPFPSAFTCRIAHDPDLANRNGLGDWFRDGRQLALGLIGLQLEHACSMSIVRDFLKCEYIMDITVICGSPEDSHSGHSQLTISLLNFLGKEQLGKNVLKVC